MCGLDPDVPSTFSTRWRRARKEHQCCACCETIRPNELYHYFSGVWDGQGDDFKHCARCWQMVCDLQALGAEAVDLTLNCGEAFEASDDHPMHGLAFVTRAEGQRFAESANFEARKDGT